MHIGGDMCREVFFWFTEYLNYFTLIFFGIKLFLKKYDVQTGRKEWVENVIIFVASMPAIIICVLNYFLLSYTNATAYFLYLYLYLFLRIYTKNSLKNSISLIVIYVNVLRLIDLLIVAVSLQVNNISRYYNWDFVHFGYDRSIFIIILVISYYFIYFVLEENALIYYLHENKFYRLSICIYSILGIWCFGRVYNFEYTEDIIGYWTFYLVCAFILFGIFIFYFIRIKSEEKNKILNIRNDMLEANYLSLQKAYDENRMLSHDFKNHMIAINQLIVSCEYDVAEEYIQRYINHSSYTKKRVESGCKIIDIIMNSKISDAIEENIEFHYEIDNVGKLAIEDIDVCALLANLLDNAIEACEKIVDDTRWINIKVFRRNDMLFIILSNSIHPDMLKKKVLFQSEKPNSQLHGWGMKSIKNVLKKYEGNIEYNLREKGIEIFLNIPL